MKWMVGCWAIASCARWRPLLQRHHRRPTPTIVAAVVARNGGRRLFFASSSSSASVVDNDDRHNDDTNDAVYRELATVAAALRDHDGRYYEGLGDVAVSDDEYDALAAREAAICAAHPTILEEYRRRSGLGVRATRFQGRVGSGGGGRVVVDIVAAADAATAITTTATTATPQLRRHAAPLLSLDNVHDATQLLAWLERIRKKMNDVDDDNNKTITIVSEPKLDGLSVALRYEPQEQQDGDGGSLLQWAATRGDGQMGTEVTEAMRSILDRLPRRLLPVVVSETENDNNASVIVVTEVRGEVILPPSLVAGGNFTNARNAAVGILLRRNNKDSDNNKEEDDNGGGDDEKDNDDNGSNTTAATTTEQLRQKLQFYAYDTVPPIPDMRDRLRDWGFSVPEPALVTTLSVPAAADEPFTETEIRPLLDHTERILALREKPSSSTSSSDTSSSFDTDGCVHKVASLFWRERLGSSRRAPRWAVAHKFPPRAAVTELLDVVVQVGRTGVLTPVAILAPVAIAGVTIQRATLHNFDHLQRNVFRLSTTNDNATMTIPKNSTVLVRRAGDVIPQVVSVVHQSTLTETISLAVPSHCPACGSPTIVDDNGDDAVKAIRCGGAQWDCPPQAVAALQHAFSRDAFDVKGLSSAKLAQLRESGYLQQPGDLFVLASNRTQLDQLQELPGWGKKSVDKLAATAQQTAQTGVSLTRFLYSLGIPSLGIHAARLVAELYGNWADIAHDLDEASRLDDDDDAINAFARLREDTEQTKGIGPTLLSHLYKFSRNRRLLDAAKALAANVTIIDDIVVPRPDQGKTQTLKGIEGPFRDMTVVFAGSISKQIVRKEAKRLARKLGAKSTPTKVTKATGLLVAGARGGKKLKEAESFGVKVMTSDEFLRIVEEHEHILLLANADDQSVSELNNVTALDETAPMLLPDQTTTTSHAPFRDRSVVFSGAIAPGVTRHTAQEWARRLGATSTPSQVSKSTGLLVAGSKVAPSKVVKAKALGVPVMDAAAFLRIVADNGLFDGNKDQDGNQRQ